MPYFIDILKRKPGSEGLATALQTFATRTATCNRITAEMAGSTSGQLGHVKLDKISDPVSYQETVVEPSLVLHISFLMATQFLLSRLMISIYLQG